MNEIMWERLKSDPGSRTIGELLQEREWAVQEIRHLRTIALKFSETRRKYVEAADDPVAPSVAGRFLRLREVMAITGLSRSTLYARIRAGRFPNVVRLGIHAVAWRGDDIIAWQKSLP
jgi:prophage regulatory protein